MRGRTERSDEVVLAVAVPAVLLYVATWALLGAVAPAHDPLRDAISELFDLGAPPWQRWTLTGVLVLTGAVLVPLAGALHRALPGEGLLGPRLTVVAGLGTVLVAAFPCTDGCPGVGASLTDTMHTVLAGAGYAGLVLAPIAWAVRLRGGDQLLVRTGFLLGGLAAIGFVTRTLLGLDELGGLQQRVFNTAADLWFVLAVVRARELTSTVSSSRPLRRSSADPA